MAGAAGTDPAAGATVDVRTDATSRTFLHYIGVTSETNDVQVFRNVKPDSRPDSSATRLTFVDRGTFGRSRRPIGITPLGGCTALGTSLPSTVSCPFAATFRRVQFRLGDGNDRLTGHTTSVTLSIYGDRGNDILRGGAANDGLYGEDGNDTLFGNGGDDSMYGGRGDDILTGGAGTQRGISGEDGDDDILDGTGDSTLRGGEGNDSIADSGGEDNIEGGAGNDRISARDGRRDVIGCGRGSADRAVVDAREASTVQQMLDNGCESIVVPR
jgi:RTX calcium-binding nonapeptide repeat (4 copies)